MKNELAGALLWFGARIGLIRNKTVQDKSAFEDGVLHERNADVVKIHPTGSRLSDAEVRLREKFGHGADVHDAALLARRERGETLPAHGADVPLGDTRED